MNVFLGVKMIKIKIAENEHLGDPLDEGWVHQQINRRREAGEAVCIRVFIEKDGVDIVLSTKNCVSSGLPSIIKPRPLEKKIIQLWEERGMNTLNFTSRDLVIFINQLQDLL